MKLMKKISFLLFLFISFFAFTGCSDDDGISLEGELYLTLVNTSDDLHVVIYSMQNSNVPLYDIPMNTYKKQISQSLNVGNYLVRINGSYYNYSVLTGVQIQQGKKTSVSYDDKNNVHVSMN